MPKKEGPFYYFNQLLALFVMIYAIVVKIKDTLECEKMMCTF